MLNFCEQVFKWYLSYLAFSIKMSMGFALTLTVKNLRIFILYVHI
jgi:hypothetical protein